MEKILILDFGSQFTQLIARRFRESNVYCEVFPSDIANKNFDRILQFNPSGIVLSGGPFSVYEKNAPQIKKFDELLKLKVPLLGICYGMQLLAKMTGGKVKPSPVREYGKTLIKQEKASRLFPKFVDWKVVWMSHGDEVVELPRGFVVTSKSENAVIASMEDPTRELYGIQFHPEVAHTQIGQELISNFLFKICKTKPDWVMSSFIQDKVKEIRELVGDKKVICALSGGVDSSVAAALVSKAIGKQLHCVFVDTGLLRANEAKEVMALYRHHMKLNIKCVNAEKLFLTELKGVTDPEIKRKRIGKTFIRLFEKEAKGASFLVQGTLYPDVIESKPPPGEKKTSLHAAKIKTHHNVGGLPRNLKFKLIEPFRELFKDEVRSLGRELGLPEEVLMRHPFPGPGLAIRILGEVSRKKIEILKKADLIFREELKKENLVNKDLSGVWQAFAVLLPVQSVGVMGDGRTFENTIALRAVSSQDAMTAEWFKFDPLFLERVSSRITSEVSGINRVVYDITNKPPSTIEWE